MAAFEPAGEMSQHEVVYLAIKDHPTGDVIPYDAMPYAQDVLTSLREKVSKTMEREQKRHVVCVTGEGWKIVSGIDHVRAADRARRNATRKMGRAVQIAQTVDRREMSAEDRVAADTALIKATAIYRAARGIASRRLGLSEINAWQKAQKERRAA